ncbi:MAG TPA: phosphate signaling complex protein PhoU [Thermoanaerobaculia bacterium]|nr:phosphate signaling complex protein PhoU [Thermoanaerobaculia bacterium]
MERHLDQQLETIRQDLLRMGGLVEGMILEANRALVERDETVVDAVLDQDREVDRLEMAIDDRCLQALVRNQPRAIDLRFLVAVMKIVNDLERMGDSAVNIVQSVHQLNQEPPLKPYIDLPDLSRLVRDMVRRSLDAFVRRDVAMAEAVCREDDEVDGRYKQLFRELLTYMMEDPRTVSRCLHLLLIARNLERIADHATNIAEDVIYYLEGRDVRHSLARAETPGEPPA